MSHRKTPHALPCLLACAFSLALGSCGGGGGGSGGAAPVPQPLVLLSLTSFLPASAEIVGGAPVNVIGTGFQAAAPPIFVRLGSRVVAATPTSDTLIQVVVPPGDGIGPVDTAVLTGSGVASLAAGFSYFASPPPPPTLGYLPAAGQAGTRVDLTVAELPPLVAPSVTFGGVPGVNLTLLSTTQVRVEVPAGLPGGVALDVVLTDGVSQVTAPGFFSQGTLNAGDLTINEFLADPGNVLDANRDGTASSSGDELVEVVNRLGVAVDLTGWTLLDSAGVRHTFPNPTSVPPGGAIVVFGSGNPTYFPARHESGHAQVAATGALGLNNTSDSIILRTPAGATIAQVNYASADVTTGISRNASVDGQAKPVPAASADYVLHDTLPGAVGPLSPGTKANGTGF